jgi:mannan endo-1,4-beta-mannosidase
LQRVHWKHKKIRFQATQLRTQTEVGCIRYKKIVDGNRLNNRITILCAFGWDGKSTNLFTGTMPKQTSWWSSYKLILQNWAIQFKTNPMYGLKYGMNLYDMIELTAIQMPFG